MSHRLISAASFVSGLLLLLTVVFTLGNSPKPTATALAAPAVQQDGDLDDRFGTGQDGDFTLPTGSPFNPNPVLVNVTAAGTSAAPASSTGFVVGDLVLFHQSRGTANVGRWEFNQIAAINSPISWTLSWPLAYTYDNTSGRAQVIKVPQYNTLTIPVGATLKATDWNGDIGGVLVAKVADTLTIQGAINMQGGNGAVGGGWFPPGGQGGGYRGGQADVGLTDCQGGGWQGEGTLGLGGNFGAANGNGGGAGHYKNNGCVGATGGGGGNRTPGARGGRGFASASMGGELAGNDELTILVFGGGGGGAADEENRNSGGGGSGGGVIILFARQVSVSGNITANGGNGAGRDAGGGGGAGGSVLLRVDTITLAPNRINARGGAGGSGAGAGGEGRIRIETCGPPPDSSLISQSASIVQVECVPPTAFFDPEPPAHQPYGLPLTLNWNGADDSGGSGLRGFTLKQSIEDELPTDLLRDTMALSHTLDLTRPCRVVTFSLSAADNVGNRSPTVRTQVQLGLQGDIDADGVIDAKDLADVEEAVGLTKGQEGYSLQLDINADDRIDSADTLWVRRHLGDRCPGLVQRP